MSDPPKTLFERIDEEIRAMHEAMDRKERKMDEYGYGPDPSRVAYDRVCAEYPGGGEEARAAFWRFLDEEKKKHPPLKHADIPKQPTLSVTGKFRVYFNRHGADPLMWCISPEDGSWEIAVPHVQIATIAETVYRKKATPDEDDGKPSAWISVEGQLTVLSNMATIGEP